MRKEIKADHPFERMEVSRDEALELGEKGRLAALSEHPQPSKFNLDIIENIPPDEKISLYRSGDFIDLCAGPHVKCTGEIGAFKVTSVASAYYKGDEKNPQLQRVYGTAFKTKKELDDYFAMLEEAKKRDHRKLGKELELFVFDDDVGPGLPMFLPRGAVIAEELEKLATEAEIEDLATEFDLLIQARKEDEQLAASRIKRLEELGQKLGDRYYLKAMNCPHHHKLFAALPRSYRDLPLRLAEYGTDYRYEK